MPEKQYHCLLPMRMDLAGGTLDIWPLYLMIKNSMTVQCSVDLFVSVHLRPRGQSKEIVLQLGERLLKFSSLDELLKTEDQKLSLIQSFCAYFNPPAGFMLEVQSDSPAGGGLGASSSLAVGLLKCLSQWLGHKYNFEQALFLCRDLEAQSLKTFAGLQDYIIPLQAVFQNKEGGSFSVNAVKKSAVQKDKKPSVSLNIIEWRPGMPKINTLTLPEEISTKHFLLVDTGRAHHSGQSNWNMIRGALAGEESELSLFKECRDVALAMAQACLQGEYQKWPDLFEKEYKTRKKLGGLYVSPEAEKIRSFAISCEDRAAVKIMGAGAGGSILIWTEQKNRLKQACLKQGIRILAFFN